jgi:hypothetical protein
MADKNTASVRLLAVEVLLAYPDTLNNALETDLWLLRDQLILEDPKPKLPA